LSTTRVQIKNQASVAVAANSPMTVAKVPIIREGAAHLAARPWQVDALPVIFGSTAGISDWCGISSLQAV